MTAIPPMDISSVPPQPPGTDPAALAAQRDLVLASLPNDKLRAEISRLRPDGPYVWAWLFPRLDGFGAGGDVKRRVKLLAGIEPRLDLLVFPGERIEFITTGVLNSPVEQFFMGLWAVLVNRTLFVFTNLRVILINAEGKGKPKTLMWQIPYARMQKYGKGTLGGVVKIKTLDGRSYTFIHVPGADRKRLGDYMNARLAENQHDALAFPSHADRDPLCAQCCSPVPIGSPACPECGDAFTNPAVPALLSLALPGLGHLYMGHKQVATFEMLGFAAILVKMGFLISATGLAGAALAVLVIATTSGIDSLVTLHVAKKGCFPRRLAWKAS